MYLSVIFFPLIGALTSLLFGRFLGKKGSIIITTTLNRDFLPSSWGYSTPNYFYKMTPFFLILLIGIFIYFRNKKL